MKTHQTFVLVCPLYVIHVAEPFSLHLLTGLISCLPPPVIYVSADPALAASLELRSPVMFVKWCHIKHSIYTIHLSLLNLL